MRERPQRKAQVLDRIELAFPVLCVERVDCGVERGFIGHPAGTAQKAPPFVVGVDGEQRVIQIEQG